MRQDTRNPMAKDPQAQAENILQQMLDLLEELTAVYTGSGDEDEDDAHALEMDEVIDGIVEEAAERGLDEDAAGRIFRAMAAYAKKSSER